MDDFEVVPNMVPFQTRPKGVLCNGTCTKYKVPVPYMAALERGFEVAPYGTGSKNGSGTIYFIFPLTVLCT